MAEYDPRLDEALVREERDLLRRLDEDPGHVDQVISLFDGRTGWVSGVVLAAQALLFIGGVWSGWRFFQADDALTALHWGLPSAVLLLMSLMLKLALWPLMQANRLRLGLKRIELMIARSRET